MEGLELAWMEGWLEKGSGGRASAGHGRARGHGRGGSPGGAAGDLGGGEGTFGGDAGGIQQGGHGVGVWRQEGPGG